MENFAGVAKMRKHSKQHPDRIYRFFFDRLFVSFLTAVAHVMINVRPLNYLLPLTFQY